MALIATLRVDEFR